MEKKEKIIISIVTGIILLGIFIAFLVSNSQKTPPEALIKNSEEKFATAQMGGYEWNVFGNTIMADALDLRTIEYPLESTLVSKTNELITISVTEKFTVQEAKYIENVTRESFDISIKNGESGNFFTIQSPELEGTYICIFKLSFYDKGVAEYGVKLVVTDEEVYDVESIISYKNTGLTNVLKIKEMLTKMPYSKQLNGTIINNLSNAPSLTIKYTNDLIEKEDLLNNTIALFALIPDLEMISYDILNDEVTNESKVIYYSRAEINNLIRRDVLEYADDAELWTKEVIYKENMKYNNDITVYISTITSMLSKVSEKDLGDFIAIDIIQRNESGDVVDSGDLILNEYDANILLNELNAEYEVVLNVDSSEFDNKGGTLVKVKIDKGIDNKYIVNLILESDKGEIIEETYEAIIENGVVMVQEFEEDEVPSEE